VLAVVIDTKALVKVIWVSFAAGAGLTVAFSLAIVGTTRLGDRQREGRTTAAVAYGALAGVALIVIVVAIVLGIKAMATK
jgi:formate/nitrite transporter FocA (FNT family)